MDGGELHRLGKRLLELSAAATGEVGDLVLTPGEAAVVENAVRHPGSSVGEISRRSGFTQSHVSASVSRLRRHGLIETAADPADGRRTRVHVTGEAVTAIGRRAARGIEGALGAAAGGPEGARRALDLLDELAALLLRGGEPAVFRPALRDHDEGGAGR